MFIAMDFKRFSLHNSFSFQKRDVLSGFILGVVVSSTISFIFIALFLNGAVEVSEVQVFRRDFDNVVNVTNSSFSYVETSAKENPQEFTAISSSPTKADMEDKKTEQKKSNFDTNPSAENIKLGIFSFNEKSRRRKRGMRKSRRKKHDMSPSHYSGRGKKTKSDFYGKCDIYDGKWVRDSSKPYYPIGSCPHIDPKFDCSRNGRPDEDYVYWRWQPSGCNIPRYDFYQCCFCICLTEKIRAYLYIFYFLFCKRKLFFVFI